MRVYAPKFMFIDMDGTILKTEDYYFQRMGEALSSFAGKDVMVDFMKELNGPAFRAVRGISGSKTLEWFANRLDIPLPADAFAKYRQRVIAGFKEWMNEARFIDGFLDFLKRYDTPYALVTTTGRVIIDEVLKYLPREPEIIISGEDVKEKKPSPLPYIYAYREAMGLFFPLFKDEVLVFEDSMPGFDSASRAGLSPIINVNTCLWEPCIHNWHEIEMI